MFSSSSFPSSVLYTQSLFFSRACCNLYQLRTILPEFGVARGEVWGVRRGGGWGVGARDSSDLETCWMAQELGTGVRRRTKIRGNSEDKHWGRDLVRGCGGDIFRGG
jgi:hypothetical protein